MKFIYCSNCKRRVPNVNFCEYCCEPLGIFRCECEHEIVKPTEIRIIPYEATSEVFSLQIDKVTMVCTKCFKEYIFSKDDFDFKNLNSIYFSKRIENEALKYANLCKFCEHCTTFHFSDKCETSDKNTSPIKTIYITNIDKLFRTENKEYRVQSGTYWFDDIIYGGFPSITSTLFLTDLGHERSFFELQYIIEGLKSSEVVLLVLDRDPYEFMSKLEQHLPIKIDKYFKMGNLRIIDLYSCEALGLPPSYQESGIIRSAKDLTSVAIAITRSLSSLKKRTTKRTLLNIISYILKVSEKHIIEFTCDTISKLKKENFTILLTAEKKSLNEKVISHLSDIMDNILESTSAKKEIDGKTFLEKSIGVRVMKNETPDPEFHKIRIRNDRMYVL